MLVQPSAMDPRSHGYLPSLRHCGVALSESEVFLSLAQSHLKHPIAACFSHPSHPSLLFPFPTITRHLSFNILFLIYFYSSGAQTTSLVSRPPVELLSFLYTVCPVARFSFSLQNHPQLSRLAHNPKQHPRLPDVYQRTIKLSLSH